MEDTDEDTVTSLDTLEEELYAKSWPPWIEKFLHVHIPNYKCFYFPAFSEQAETLVFRKEYVTGLLLQLKTISKRAHWIAEWLIGERRSDRKRK